MFKFENSNQGQRIPKIHTTVGALPGHIDPTQPPGKKKPWSTIQDGNGASGSGEGGFVRSLEILMPGELYAVIWDKINPGITSVRYHKVIMKLEQILDGDFFNEYIKKGNILMLSEGRPGVDNVFSLRDGILRLDVDKESYERAGLQGQSIATGGRKHIKSRFRIEVNLRLPSMLHGKKGFERVVAAAKNTFNMSLVWLFADLSSQSMTGSSTGNAQPIDQFHPTAVDCKPIDLELPKILVPPLCPPAVEDSTQLQDWVYETTEWLGLVGLESPRVREGDAPDSYLSRLSLPEGTLSTGTTLRKVRWFGLLNSQFITQLLIELIRVTRNTPNITLPKVSTWISFTICLHETDFSGQLNGYTILSTAQSPQASRQHGLRSNGAEASEETNEATNVHEPSRPGLQFYSHFEFADSN